MDHFRIFDGVSFSFAVWCAQMVAYHGFGLWFEWLDQTGRGARFKVRAADRMSYRELLPRVLFNQVFVLLPAMVLAQALGLAYYGSSRLTTLGVVLSCAGLTIGHDVVQYAAHRLVLHDPANMRKLGHAVHHATRASRGISACYMSAADFFLEIVCPYLLPLILIGGGGTNFIFHALIVSAGAYGGVYEHSGYDFGLALRQAGGWRRILGRMLSTEAHGFHHTRGNVSFSDGFGSSNICDTLFKTRWDIAPGRERRPDTTRVA
jgi:sterol desaturase/sphingolipid hydroxylase (fatty acid hydroxylase superfamily)